MAIQLFVITYKFIVNKLLQIVDNFSFFFFNTLKYIFSLIFICIILYMLSKIKHIFYFIIYTFKNVNLRCYIK